MKIAPGKPVVPAQRSGLEAHKGGTPMQRHVAFFDKDMDGVIWPKDTYVGFRELKFGLLIALFSTVLVHGGLAYLTSTSWFPDPFFRVYTKNIHRAKHGSDTEAYTRRGEFNKRRFDEMFKMYTKHPHTHISGREVVGMIRGNMAPWDFESIFYKVSDRTPPGESQ